MGFVLVNLMEVVSKGDFIVGGRECGGEGSCNDGGGEDKCFYVFNFLV